MCVILDKFFTEGIFSIIQDIGEYVTFNIIEYRDILFMMYNNGSYRQDLLAFLLFRKLIF